MPCAPSTTPAPVCPRASGSRTCSLITRRSSATRGGTLPDAYAEALDVAGQIAAALPLGRARPCHNDLLAGNIIRAPRRRDDA